MPLYCVQIQEYRVVYKLHNRPCPNPLSTTSAILYDRNCYDRNCFPTVKFCDYHPIFKCVALSKEDAVEAGHCAAGVRRQCPTRRHRRHCHSSGSSGNSSSSSSSCCSRGGVAATTLWPPPLWWGSTVIVAPGPVLVVWSLTTFVGICILAKAQPKVTSSW